MQVNQYGKLKHSGNFNNAYTCFDTPNPNNLTNPTNPTMASKRPAEGDGEERDAKRTRREGGEQESEASVDPAVPQEKERSPTNSRGTPGTVGSTEEASGSGNSTVPTQEAASAQTEEAGSSGQNTTRRQPSRSFHPNSPIRMVYESEFVYITEYEMDDHGNLIWFDLPEGH